MARLFKLVMNATTTTVAKPAVKRYEYKLASAQISGIRIVISYNRFYNDADALMTTPLTTLSSSNGYYLLFVNGVCQQSSLYTIASNGSTVTIISGGTSLHISAPITLIVNNFAPSSSTTVTG